MADKEIHQEDILDVQFGYNPYFDMNEKLGWLLTFKLNKNLDDAFECVFYFVDEYSNNFKITVPYYPSLVIEVKEEVNAVEEYIKKRFGPVVHSIEVVDKYNVSEFNHLNKPPKEYIKVFFRTDLGFQSTLKALREIIETTEVERHKNEIYLDYCTEKMNFDITTQILQIHEFDIPNDIQVGMQYNVRCGLWYFVSYNGDEYKIVQNTDKIAYPDLRIFAYDIETTKQPLKFPNPEFDEVMMISIMTEEFGELIVNRKIISEDIQEFEYHAKDDMKGTFRIYNEENEEALLLRFLEIIIEYRPHIITTYNGGFFDWPFVEARMKKYDISLYKTLQFSQTEEYYECPFISHLDCYKWVKRDSYLPMNNQGLKDVTRIKLDYFPDEIDPEDMVKFAREDPQKLASYSVSDAVATFYLYIKFVHSHIFSICSLIPLPPVQILCKGAGTLCESLLLAESEKFKILIPKRKKASKLEYYDGKIVENMTYVGGHVESLKAGIFRADFEDEYAIDKDFIDLVIDNLDQILTKYSHLPEYADCKKNYEQKLLSCIGKSRSKGAIYHLDVGAMYPNIILTNRLQPYSIVDDNTCIRCDFNKKSNNCKRSMNWVSRVEFIPPGEKEISMIKNQLENETFNHWNGEKSTMVGYKDLPVHRQEQILKERVVDYSKNIYKRVRKVEEKQKEAIVCQREIPFYVETVRKFRDQRYVYKELYKKAMIENDKNPSVENKKRLTVYSSLQVAYKCLLNSFYGYVMREGSRWYSLEMAAVVCNTGGQIIKLAKELFEKIGVPLELDTDGIWGILPASFPFDFEISGKKVPVLSMILNYFVCKKFTNYQYQILKEDGSYETISKNEIFFELDGPYKTMIIPSSTEENKLLKKRYVVFDYKNKICELKGFELKRRGELNFIKKFQQDLFNHFNDGSTLQECYDSIAVVCNYWLDIIEQKGSSLADEDIFYLFSESRNMARNVESYGNKKSNILSTAKRLSEFLGDDILEEKLKCEFVISKYPINAPIVDRAIPVMIFKSSEKDIFLKKWQKTSNANNLRDILDWDYYRKRFESILLRLIVIPAYFQKIPNPISRVELPGWVKESSKKEKLAFVKVDDIEDIVTKRKLYDTFYTKDFVQDNEKLKLTKNETVNDIDAQTANSINTNNKKEPVNIFDSEFIDFINENKSSWIDFFNKQSSLKTNVIKIEAVDNNKIEVSFFNGSKIYQDEKSTFYLDVSDKSFFSSLESNEFYLSDKNQYRTLFKLVLDDPSRSNINNEFLDHFSIRSFYKPISKIGHFLSSHNYETTLFDYATVSSFNFNKKPVFVITLDQTYFVSDLKHPNIIKNTLNSFKITHFRNIKALAIPKEDPNFVSISEAFSDLYQIPLDIFPKFFLESFDNLLIIHKNFHIELKNELLKLEEISKFAKIPLLNIDSELLDHMLYREFINNNVLVTPQTEFYQNIIKEEMVRPGYYGSYCVMFECKNSLLLSIIDYKSISPELANYHGYRRKDFQVLREFLRNLILAAVKNNVGIKSILPKVAYWLKKQSKLISSDLKEIIEITHQQYLIGLLSKLKKDQYSIVGASKEIFIIDTEKHDFEGCNLYIQHLKNKISKFEGYELLNFQPLKVYERLAFVDFDNHFFIDVNNIYSKSSRSLPEAFLKDYFYKEEIKNEDFYPYVKAMTIDELKLALKILSFRRDVNGLASNCYKLKKKGEFCVTEEKKFNLSIFCKNCLCENIIRPKCIKCNISFDRASVEDECVKYLRHVWLNEMQKNRVCSKCEGSEQRKLKDYCNCGGKFVRKSYKEEILKLKDFVNTKPFDKQVEQYINFFN